MSSEPLLICASTQYWDEAWFRKQHFMSRLSRKRPVLYLEPSFSLLRQAPAQCPDGQRNPLLRPRIRQRDAGLWTLTPPRGLPFWTHPMVSRVQYQLWGRMLRRAAAGLGYTRTWLWLYNPLYVQVISTLRPERLILDLVDDLAAYEARAHSRRTVRSSLEEALGRADLVLATSPGLVEAAAPQTRSGRVHLVPNGVRGGWIDRAPGPPPEEIRDLPRPLIGFVGAVFSYLDFEILAHVARAFPQGSLVLVGPVLAPGPAKDLAAIPNVRMIGARPQETIPDFLGGFDVCVCPFRRGDIRRAVNPLKIYEYLAAGRPVVATPLESLLDEPVANHIRFAEGGSAFVDAIRAALREETPTEQQARRDGVRAYAWESLSERVEAILEEAEERWNREGGPQAERGRGN